MSNILLYIMPTYYCNNDCEYCYLGDMRNNTKILNLDTFKIQFNEIKNKFNIEEINIFGGEVSLLPTQYVKELLDICKEYYTGIITNYSNPYFNKFLNDNNILHSTTINDERNNNKKIENLLLKNKSNNLSLIQVVTPSLLLKSPYNILKHIEKFNVNNIGFLQYSPALNSKIKYEITNKEFGNFIKNIIIEYNLYDYKFKLINIDQLDQVINSQYDPTMKAVLFINPYNDYCSVEYVDGLEFFKSYNTLDEWINECKNIDKKYPNECITCEYYGRCYAEHIREWNKDDECVGFKSLIEWYKEYKNEKDLYQDD